MAVSRADTLSKVNKTQIYSDFFDSFASSPNSGDLAMKTNVDSVKQSIKNLVLTDMDERLYQPLIGTNAHEILFEPNDLVAFESLKSYITYVIKNFEPRVQQFQIDIVSEQEDSDYLTINVYFTIINNPITQTVSINLRRVR